MKNNTLIKILAAPVVLAGAALAMTGGRRGNSAWEKLRGWRYAPASAADSSPRTFSAPAAKLKCRSISGLFSQIFCSISCHALILWRINLKTAGI